MESRGDSENAERILFNMSPRQLVEVACNAYHQDEDEDDDEDEDEDGGDGRGGGGGGGGGDGVGVSPKEVGHNIYILCHQLAQHNRDLAGLLKPHESLDCKMAQALQYYASHTAQIEVGDGGERSGRGFSSECVVASARGNQLGRGTV